MFFNFGLFVSFVVRSNYFVIFGPHLCVLAPLRDIPLRLTEACPCQSPRYNLLHLGGDSVIRDAISQDRDSRRAARVRKRSVLGAGTWASEFHCERRRVCRSLGTEWMRQIFASAGDRGFDTAHDRL